MRKLLSLIMAMAMVLSMSAMLTSCGGSSAPAEEPAASSAADASVAEDTADESVVEDTAEESVVEDTAEESVVEDTAEESVVEDTADASVTEEAASTGSASELPAIIAEEPLNVIDMSLYDADWYFCGGATDAGEFNEEQVAAAQDTWGGTMTVTFNTDNTIVLDLGGNQFGATAVDINDTNTMMLISTDDGSASYYVGCITDGDGEPMLVMVDTSNLGQVIYLTQNADFAL